MSRARGQPGDAVKIFARLRAAVVECPRCLAICDLKLTRWKGKTAEDGSWDPATQVWHCRCGARYAVGVVLYDLVGKWFGTAPEDTRANGRQAAQLREIARGSWIAGGSHKRVNRLVQEEDGNDG